MIAKHDLTPVEPFVYEIGKHLRQDMRVPARIYADDYILEMALSDKSIEQLTNTATLPGVVKYALAMPDMHQGYGFPIGGVAAMVLPDGVISPGGVGYDINCGVRLLTCSIEVKAVRSHMDKLMTALFQNVPTGVGGEGDLRLSDKDLRTVLNKGAAWAVGRGLGTERDLEHTEDHGCMTAADASAVSARALERGREQVGTLGSGNHFLEVDEIVEVYDQEVAAAFGLVPGHVCVWVHCGSRGLGHQICTDAVSAMQRSMAKYNFRVPDRELVSAPFESPEGRQYFAAMCCAANYAWANRQAITHNVRKSFDQALAGVIQNRELLMLYDVCHNIAKVEHHVIDGHQVKLCVHRKGATRAFGPNLPEVPDPYRHLGQPVLIPGDMGTGSYVLVGTAKAMSDTFGSTCHGAGRVASRAKARQGMRGEDLRAELEHAGIVVRAGSLRGLAEESPDAYKDLDSVVNVVHQAGLALKVARTRPLGVIKG